MPAVKSSCIMTSKTKEKHNRFLKENCWSAWVHVVPWTSSSNNEHRGLSQPAEQAAKWGGREMTMFDPVLLIRLCLMLIFYPVLLSTTLKMLWSTNVFYPYSELS